MALRVGTTDFHLRWQALGAPQRPCAAVAAAMQQVLAARPGPALQLGVTPEIALLSKHGVAVDFSADMIRIAWPGDCATHRAILGNWLALELDDASMDVAFGDGCMSTLRWPNEYHLFLREIQRVLMPGGRLLLRCFVGPDTHEHVEDIAREAYGGRIPDFGGFKLRLNMAAFQTAHGADNSGDRIHRLFQQHFPDRERLKEATGWSSAEVASIDAYANALSVHTYPTRNEIVALLPASAQCRFVETAGYPLAERCPLLIVDYQR